MKNVLFIFLLPLFLYSQTLEELVKLSINNRLVESTQKKLESLKYEYRSVVTGNLPQLNVGTGYSVTNKERFGVPRDSASAYASASYNIFEGGKQVFTYAGYNASIKSSEKSLDSLKNDIALTVITYYFNYLSYMSQKDAKLKQIEQLDAQKERLKRYFDAGTTTEDELQKIISNTEVAKVELKEIDLNIITILHNLEYIVGDKIDIQKGSNLVELEDTNKESNRFDIQSLQFGVEEKLYTSRAQLSGYLPTINIDDTYTYFYKKYRVEQNNAGTDIKNQNILSVNLTWNIFSFGQTQLNYESKYKDYLSSKLNLEYEKNKANVDLQLAVKAYEIAKAKITSAEANLKAADIAYSIIKSKYENGLVDNIAFLQSLSEKFDAISLHKTSLNDLEIKKANIIYQSGQKLEEYIK